MQPCDLDTGAGCSVADITKAKEAGYYSSGFYNGPATQIPPATGAAGAAILGKMKAARDAGGATSAEGSATGTASSTARARASASTPGASMATPGAGMAAGADRTAGGLRKMKAELDTLQVLVLLVLVRTI